MSDRLTALRGVESGFAIARSTRDGMSSVSDRFGRILVEARSGSAPAVLRYTLRLAATAHSTVYSRVGDLFGWTAAFCAALMLIWMRAPSHANPRDRGRRDRAKRVETISTKPNSRSTSR